MVCGPGRDRRPRGRRPGRRLHRPRRRRRRRDLAEDGLRRAARARPAPAARAARRRHGRRRLGQVAGDDGLHLRPAAPRLRARRRQPAARAGGRRGARAGGRPRRGARGRLALLGDRARHARSCSSPARRWSPRRWASRPTRRRSAARAPRHAPGAVDNEAADEDDALAQLRRFLSYLPASAWEPPPVTARTDPPDRREEALLSIVPRDPRKPYDMRRVLDAVLDRGSVFELGAPPRPSLISRAGPARRPPRRRARERPEALRRRADRRRVGQARALRRPVRPVPPAGRQPRRPAGLRDRHRRRARAARCGAERARCSPSTRRRCRGCRCWSARSTASRAPAHGDASRLNLRYAWPSGDWGSLPIAGGLEAAYRRELEAAEDPRRAARRDRGSG